MLAWCLALRIHPLRITLSKVGGNGKTHDLADNLLHAMSRLGLRSRSSVRLSIRSTSGGSIVNLVSTDPRKRITLKSTSNPAPVTFPTRRYVHPPTRVPQPQMYSRRCVPVCFARWGRSIAMALRASARCPRACFRDISGWRPIASCFLCQKRGN